MSGLREQREVFQATEMRVKSSGLVCASISKYNQVVIWRTKRSHRALAEAGLERLVVQS